jgi:hypothetical protein
MTEQEKRDLLQWVIEEERKRPPKPEPPRERPTIHWTELKELPPGERGAQEWNFYVKQIGRLLAEGQEGRWVLVKGEEIIGIWDTEKEADQVRVERFLKEPVLIQQILTREPIYRGPTFFRLWPN